MPHQDEQQNLLGITSPGELAKAELSNAGIDFDEDPVEKEFQITNLAALVRSKVEEAKVSRTDKEARMFRNVKSFKGEDNHGDKLRTETELTDIYLRTTTVKTRAAFAQLTEAILGDSRFPIEVTESRVPEGIAEFAHLGEGPMELEDTTEVDGRESQADFGFNALDFGFEGDGQELAPGADVNSFSFLGGLEEELGGEQALAEGPGRSGEPTIRPAKIAAQRVDKVIQDQLASTKARTELRRAIFECCVLGAGALKGPFNVNQTINRWERGEDGKMQYTPINKVTPQLSFVSMWNLYVDPNATRVEDADWVAEKHRMSFRMVADLKRRPNFDEDAIDAALSDGPNYVESQFENELHNLVGDNPGNDRWEVWEYWGYMPTDLVRDHGIEVPEESGDVIQVNLWYSGSRVLRLTLNPFLPARIPYYIFPYEEKPYELIGTGVPEAMEDSQSMINGFARLAVENGALAGNLVFDIDESSLVQGQEMSIYPGKVFKRMAGSSGAAINSIQFPDTSQANLAMMREFRQHADEATGIPSIAHGQTGVSGFGRTSSGMSMILNNASLNSKTVIRNIDDYLLKPLGMGMYNWNMQFNAGQMPDIVGDLDVVAQGSQSLQMKEVRAQRLQTFLQISANPALAPLIKFPTILKDLAHAMDMNPDEILNSPDEQAIYARLMGQMGAAGAQPGAAGIPGQGPGVAVPGESAFTGNNEGSGNALGLNSSDQEA
jgi:hypothetical protein